jgi:hypothetical protein
LKRIITLKLTRKEADALMDVGNAGIADMHDAQDDDSLKTADVADDVLTKLGQAMRIAGWANDAGEPT